MQGEGGYFLSEGDSLYFGILEKFLYALGGLLLTLRIQELVGLTDPKEVVIERIKERIEIAKENTKRKERLLRGRCGDGTYREKKSR